MTTDIERELRELFREKAGEAPVSTLGASAAAPQRVLRRGRRHQVGTVLGSTLLALLIAVGSFAGLRSLLRSDSDPFQTGREYEVFERTATIEAFTITSPSDWFLVNEWPLSMLIAVEGTSGASDACVAAPGDVVQGCNDTGEETSSPIPVPHGLPMLQLSNVDLGLTTNACADGLPADGAALYVALDAHPPVGADTPPIPEFPPGTGLPPEGDGPCGLGRYAHFKVNGEPLFAWIGIGSEVTDEDRETVENSYETLSAISDWELAPPVATTPGYVLAGGFDDQGEAWRLELRPSDENVELSLAGADPGGSAAGFTVPAVPVEACCEYESGFTEVAFGAVARDATGVEIRPADGAAPIPGTIVPLPPNLPFAFDLFFVDGTDGLTGEVIALGLGSTTVEPPEVAEPRARAVELGGSFEGQEWSVRFTGAFEDGTACIHVTIVEPYEPSCHGRVENTFAAEQPSSDSWVTEQMYLGVSSVPPEVDELRFVGDDDAIVPQRFRCAMGPVGWTNPDRKVCAIALPPEGSGTLEFVDASGDVLFEQGMGWGVAEPESDQYPWTNENGFITAAGSSEGAGWKLQVLYYRDGYRLTFDGDVLFEGRLRVGEPQVITLGHGATEPTDTIVLVLTGTQAEDVAVVHDSGQRWAGRWIPGSTANGEEARVWLIELPGRGSGAVFVDGVVRSEVSWP